MNIAEKGYVILSSWRTPRPIPRSTEQERGPMFDSNESPVKYRHKNQKTGF